MGCFFGCTSPFKDSLENWLLLYVDLVAVIELARQNAEASCYNLVAFTQTVDNFHMVVVADAGFDLNAFGHSVIINKYHASEILAATASAA